MAAVRLLVLAEAEATNRIKEARSRAGLTLRALSDLSDLSPAFIQKLEKGDRGLRVHSLRQLARALGVPVADLLSKADGGLSLDERALVVDFRNLDENTRAVILDMMRGFNRGNAEGGNGDAEGEISA